MKSYTYLTSMFVSSNRYLNIVILLRIGDIFIGMFVIKFLIFYILQGVNRIRLQNVGNTRTLKSSDTVSHTV